MTPWGALRPEILSNDSNAPTSPGLAGSQLLASD